MAEDQNDELKEDKELVKASAFQTHGSELRRVDRCTRVEETLPTKHIAPGGNPVSLDLHEKSQMNIFS